MTRRQLLLLGLGAAVVIIAVFAFLSTPGPSATSPAPGAVSTPGSGAPPTATASAPSALPSPAATVSPTPGLSLLDEMQALADKLRRGQAGVSDLEALRRKLLSMDPRQAIAAITEFLQSGDDARTGLPFSVSEGGGLANAPTLRTFLMDLLGQISRQSGSGAAATYARSVLETKTSPEEWALSLRNVAWHEPAAAPYLSSKMREMLSEPAWNESPSPGLLEAFDVIVFTGDPRWIPDLAAISHVGSSGLTDVQRAALLTLDRLSENSPLAVMNFLNENPTELADRPMLRADYYAKVDLTQPDQQAALEAYLGRPDVTLEEKTKLIKALASPGSFITDALLTKPQQVQNDDARLQAVGKTLTTWVGANRFPELKGTMQQVLTRLQ